MGFWCIKCFGKVDSVVVVLMWQCAVQVACSLRCGLRLHRRPLRS